MSEVFRLLLSDTIGRWFLYVGVFLFFAVLAVLVFLSIRRHLRSADDRLSKALEELGIIRHEVKNDHKTNLRVEQDDRHDENRDTLARIEGKVDAMAITLGVHEYRLNEFDTEIGSTRDRRPE